MIVWILLFSFNNVQGSFNNIVQGVQGQRVPEVTTFSDTAPVNELFPLLFGDNPYGAPAQTAAPDPLVTTTWSAGMDLINMQRYEVLPELVTSLPSSTVMNANSLLALNASATFTSFGRLFLDFGVERAAWFEFVSPDLSLALSQGDVIVKGSISEYSEPWTGKTIEITSYDDGLFRLETNTPEIYEGVRYAWIMYEPAESGAPGNTPPAWTITSARLQAQVKPVNYTASFTSSDETTTAIWYTGAYGSRLNMHEQSFGSILVDRGDRTSIQGDGHPTMAAALAAFASTEVHRLVHVMLQATDSGCKGCHVVDDGIMSYPVLWTMSAHDWLWSSGNKSAFLTDFSNDISTILDNDMNSFLQNPSISLQGWDDRLGNGWCWGDQPCGREPQLTFAAQLLMAIREFSAALDAAGDAVRASKYSKIADSMVATFRKAVPFDDGTLGVHSASMFLNVEGLVQPSEVNALVATYMSDSTSICSWSPFNSYWILQGLGNAGLLDRAAEMAAICWGGMTRLSKGCFWELWEPMWEPLLEPGGKAPTRPSYCHAWSDGVTAWLSRAIGGINPVSPGFGSERGYVVTPHVSALRPRVSSSIITPSGETISVHAERNGASRTIRVLSSGTHGIVGLPLLDDDEDDITSCELVRLFVNGIEAPKAILSASELGGALRFRRSLPRTHAFSYSLPAGEHVVRGEYACSSEREAVFPPISWQATSWAVDTDTHGSWQGKYGTDGLVLFAFDLNGTTPIDIASLPGYAASVSVHKGPYNDPARTCLGLNETDVAFLQDPRANTTRRLGYVSSGGDGSQGVSIDVNLTVGTQVAFRTVSFYVSSTQQPTSVVDSYQNGEPSMVLRIMDINNFNPVAPDVRIDAFDAGQYYSVTFCCGCSNASKWCGVRVRFMQIDGTNTVSGVFFDTAVPPTPVPQPAYGGLSSEMIGVVASGGAFGALLLVLAVFMLRRRQVEVTGDDDEGDDNRYVAVN